MLGSMGGSRSSRTLTPEKIVLLVNLIRAADAASKFCDECRCFICRKPPRQCGDWSAHCLAASTSIQSQQRRKLYERRRIKNGEPKFEETLTARCFYVDLGSSRGTPVNGCLARGRVPLRPGTAMKIGHTSLTFAIQQAGAAKPPRCEPDSESSDDDSEPKKEAEPAEGHDAVDAVGHHGEEGARHR